MFEFIFINLGAINNINFLLVKLAMKATIVKLDIRA